MYIIRSQYTGTVSREVLNNSTFLMKGRCFAGKILD
jgi:hypothetical protein